MPSTDAYITGDAVDTMSSHSRRGWRRKAIARADQAAPGRSIRPSVRPRQWPVGWRSCDDYGPRWDGPWRRRRWRHSFVAYLSPRRSCLYQIILSPSRRPAVCKTGLTLLIRCSRELESARQSADPRHNVVTVQPTLTPNLTFPKLIKISLVRSLAIPLNFLKSTC